MTLIIICCIYILSLPIYRRKENDIVVMEAFNCSEKGCDGIVSPDGAAIVLRVGCFCFNKAIACSKCGRLYFASSQGGVTTRDDPPRKAYLKNGKMTEEGGD